ncbi:hypothetical protein QVD17_40671 [Tagetes erecta]|uniref:Leucine-rich repeat-containing N-terminal plant-type domain-containing protein n=1 Tax=Tagetes erecta TaxID=13708 RepID=A0AAD8JW69_TARER|nr:hypothetical protein QVD17_40671 [Tagetes erecta]
MHFITKQNKIIVAWGIWAYVLFSQVLVISACDSDDLRGLTGFMKGLESPIDGWWHVDSSSSSDCCNWIGITCDSSTGRIVKLQLPKQRLVGHFSDSIFYLDQLTTLNLCLTQLRLLDLSWNELAGTIPAYLGEFKFLFYLDLSNNSLSGEIPKNITRLQSMISRDVSLQEPSPDFPFFMNSNVTGRGSVLQYNQIMRFPPTLDFGTNLLKGPIWPEFENMKKLHVLRLDHNHIQGTIPSSLSGMRSIETLDLSYNKLTGTIPPSLGKLNFLSHFSVAHNNLKGVIPTEGQFSTFSHSSFDGNPGLCGIGYVTCKETQDKTPSSEDDNDDDDFYILLILVLTGFGTGFLLSVISLLVVPRIRGTNKVDRFE